MRVFLADKVAPECESILAGAGFEVDNRPGLQGEELAAAVAAAAGVVVRSATQVTADLIAGAPKLRVIGRAGSGVDNIDVVAATARGILVMNAPGENTLSAVEHTFALLMAMCRNIPSADALLRGGEWSKKGLMGVELHGKTLGVLGVGRIGREVATRAKAFGCKIVAYDPFLPAEVAKSLGFEMVELDELWPRVDFLTIHAPLTDKTRHVVGAAALARCRDGVRIVNCARGGLVDEEALRAALESGKVASAALDVFEREPPPSDHPLRSHPRVIVTPHLGASTTEAQERVALRIAEQIAGYLLTGAVVNAVNTASVDPALAGRLAPYLRLAEAMGLLLAHLQEGRFEELQVEVAGDIAELPVEAIKNAALAGFLGQLLSQTVNFVNASTVARKQGYAVTEIKGSDSDGYAGLLTVRLRGDRGEHLLAGTVFAGKLPKIVRIDDYHIETAPKGPMLFCGNEDLPGRLASMTAVVAKHEVNVANLSLGRDRPAAKALAAFNLDSPLSEAALADLRAIPGVVRVLAVDFPP